MTTELTRYEAMHHAIVAAHSVDEVAAIRNQAEALRMYAKQSRMSIDDINRVAEIKLRAERRGGELLTDMERAQGQRTDLQTSVQAGPKLTLQAQVEDCLLYTSPSPRDRTRSRMPSSA